MTFHPRTKRGLATLFSLPLLTLILILSACGGSSTGAGGNSGSSNNNGNISLTVGGKLDTEAQLLTKMYTLLLRKQGFKVTEKAKLGTNDIVFNAINSGQIDVYPEFTATGLARLKTNTTHNAQQDYQKVKQGYETNYKVTWLDPAPLNDTYGICTTKANAQKQNVQSISQLSSSAASKTIATPPDGKTDPNVLPALKPVYGFDFGNVKVLDAALTYNAVQQGQADYNICYTTSSFIKQKDFVLLNDDKQAFPIYNPAPLVRQDTLQKAPDIAKALNPLAPKLTTDVSIELQGEVTGGKSVTEVATNFLKQQGLL